MQAAGGQGKNLTLAQALPAEVVWGCLNEMATRKCAGQEQESKKSGKQHLSCKKRWQELMSFIAANLEMRSRVREFRNGYEDKRKEAPYGCAQGSQSTRTAQPSMLERRGQLGRLPMSNMMSKEGHRLGP